MVVLGGALLGQGLGLGLRLDNRYFTMNVNVNFHCMTLNWNFVNRNINYKLRGLYTIILAFYTRLSPMSFHEMKNMSLFNYQLIFSEWEEAILIAKLLSRFMYKIKNWFYSLSTFVLQFIFSVCFVSHNVTGLYYTIQHTRSFKKKTFNMKNEFSNMNHLNNTLSL